MPHTPPLAVPDLSAARWGGVLVPRNPSLATAPPVDLVHRLVSDYFCAVINNPLDICHFHPAVVMRRLALGLVHPMLQYALLAVAARTVGHRILADPITATHVWMACARTHDDLSCNLEVLQAHVCFFLASMGHRDIRRIHLDSGRVIKALQTLGVDQLDAPDTPIPDLPVGNLDEASSTAQAYAIAFPPDVQEYITRESLRRIWWAAYLVDQWLSLDAHTPLFVTQDDMYLRVPDHEAMFLAGTPPMRSAPLFDLDYDLRCARMSVHNQDTQRYRHASPFHLMLMLTVYYSRTAHLLRIRTPFNTSPDQLHVLIDQLIVHDIMLQRFPDLISDSFAIETILTPERAYAFSGQGLHSPLAIFIRLFGLSARMSIFFTLQGRVEELLQTPQTAALFDAYRPLVPLLLDKAKALATECVALASATSTTWSQDVHVLLCASLFKCALCDVEYYRTRAPAHYRATGDTHAFATLASPQLAIYMELIHLCEVRWPFVRIYRDTLQQLYDSVQTQMCAQLADQPYTTCSRWEEESAPPPHLPDEAVYTAMRMRHVE